MCKHIVHIFCNFVVSGIILFLMLRAVAVYVGVLSEVCASIQRWLLAALGVHIFTIPHLQSGKISIIFSGVYYSYGAGDHAQL